MFTLRLKTPTLVTSRPPGRRFFHPSFPLFQPQTDLQESAQKQTQVSAKLTSQIFLNQFPKTNCFFSPLSVHYMLNNYIAKETAKGNTLKELLGFLKMKTKHENDHLYAHFDNVLSKTADFPGCFGISSNTLLLMPVQQFLAGKQVFMNDHYAKGGWYEMFDYYCSQVKQSDFYLGNGKKVKVPFMMSKEKKHVLLFGEYDGFKVVGFTHFKSREKEEAECKFTVYVFLPDVKGGLESLVKKMGSASDEFFERYIPEEKVEMDEFAIPMFNIYNEFNVACSLKRLGLLLPFSVEHGTPEMFDSSCGRNLCILGIHQHFGFSLLNQKKGEASCGSVGGECLVDFYAGVGCSETVKTKVDFIVDRPFLFVIRDDVSKVVFFVGQVIDPSVRVEKMWYPHDSISKDA